MKIQNIASQLQPLEADFAENVDAIRREVKAFDAALAEIDKENRDLVIAIVGRVKSGKSSFLNALLFNGESVLPQAATPMTAALTFIRYDKTCHAEVEFFSRGEWDTFTAKAAKCEEERRKVVEQLERREKEHQREAALYGEEYTPRTFTDAYINDELGSRLSEDQKAASELVSMAKSSGIDVSEYLGQRRTIEGSSPLELAEKLKDFVGAKGHYTPLVCSTTIYLNDPGLEGYCVIDTPGTNDPVISRGKKTQDNLKKADVVFVVSPGNRFFDQRDLTLCSQNLPSNGINRFVVLISQFDVAIQEHRGKIDMSLPPPRRLFDVMTKARNELVGHYQQTVKANASLAAKTAAADVEKWRHLLVVKDKDGTERQNVPLCVSSMAYILSKHWGRFSDKEQSEFERFNKLVPGFAFESPDLLRRLSFMDDVFREVDTVKRAKPETIAKRKADFAVLPARRIREMVVELRDFVKGQINELESTNLAQLSAKLTAQTRLMEKCRFKLFDVFESKLTDVRDGFSQMVYDLRERKSKYSHISVQEETRQGSTSKKHSRAEQNLLFKGVDYFFGKGTMDNIFGPVIVTNYYTYKTRYAETYQAVEQVDEFSNKARELLEKGIKNAVNIQSLRRDIVKAAFDFVSESGQRDFDLDKLKMQIEKTVRSIEIPDANLGDVDYTEVITQSFSGGRVEDDDIELLRAAQREAIKNVIMDLEARASAKMKAIESALENARDTFVDDMIRDLKKNTEQVANSLKDKKATLERWTRDITILDECLKGEAE